MPRITLQRSTQAPETVAQLCDRYQAWADEYYTHQRDGNRTRTRESWNMRDAMRTLRVCRYDTQDDPTPIVIAEKAPSRVNAEDLLACQLWMIQEGLARSTINARVNRIRRVFRWAHKPPRQWVPASTLESLRSIEALQYERTEARETRRVTPVTHSMVIDTLTALNDPGREELRTMIWVHRFTGMRPGELVRMRRDELVHYSHPEIGRFLVYCCPEHKTKHHTREPTLIVIGPEAQSELRTWINKLPPREMQPRVFPSYSVSSYRWEVARACRRAFPHPELRKYQSEKMRSKLRAGSPLQYEALLAWEQEHHWSPNQLRHLYGTEMDDQFGKTTAQAVLRHKHISTTQIYTETAIKQAVEAAMKYRPQTQAVRLGSPFDAGGG